MRTLVITALLGMLWGCESKPEKEARLVEIYCGNCHLAPKPNLLSRALWAESVLPRMGARLGLNADLFIQDVPGADLTTALNLLPSKPTVTPEEWDIIRNYYLRDAPEVLPAAAPIALDTTLQLFAPERVRVKNNHIPASTFVHIQNSKVAFGFSEFYEWHAGTTVSFGKLPTPPAAIAESNNGVSLLALVGTINPTDEPLGSVWRKEPSGSWAPWIENLKRPVDLQVADLLGNGSEHMVLCEFGNLTGGLSIWEVSQDGPRQPKQISALPGARKTIVTDADADGIPDILALFAQGDEQIIFFKGDGKLGFSPSVWLRFPPVYGSSFFEFEDVDGNGFRDLVVAHGDNADHTVTRKPYHGVRIYSNNGKNQFTETYFYPLPGASQTATADFDGDGDQDIAAITFFPDFSEQSSRSFVLLTNQQQGWRAATSSYAGWGRWLVMDAGDLDDDSDIDLVLGALDFNGGASQELFSAWVAEQTPLLILRNNLKNK